MYPPPGQDALSDFAREEQIFAQHERVHPVRVIARDNFRDAIAMPLVEGQRWSVVYGSLQNNGVARYHSQAVFDGEQQLRTNAEAAACRQHINANDVAHDPTVVFRDDETHDTWCRLDIRSRVARRRFPVRSNCLGHKRKGSPFSNIGSEFPLRVCNTRRKAFLINAPQAIEILRPVVPEDKFHPVIVARVLEPFLPSR